VKNRKKRLLEAGAIRQVTAITELSWQETSLHTGAFGETHIVLQKPATRM
jgi:hypothetical protein